MRIDILERKAEILNWISENRSKAFMAKELSCKIDTLDSWLIRMNIDYAGNKAGKSYPKFKQYNPASLYLHKGQIIGSHKLKLKLFKEGIKAFKCEWCDVSTWMGQPAPLELDHIDGDHWNNELSNLRILCANCHAQTETYCGKNKNLMGN